MMPNSTLLYESEKGQIIAYRKCGMSGREIKRTINKCKTVIDFFFF